MELRIDPELQVFITPLSADEYHNLEVDILANGCREPLVVWNGVIVDGHHRYEICRRHDLDFKAREESFSSKIEAMLWMYKEQNCRRNLSTVARCVMALKCKPLLMEAGRKKQNWRADVSALVQSTESHNTRSLIAKLAGTSENTVQRIERIWEKADPDLKAALLNGEISVNKAFRQMEPTNTKKKQAPALSEQISPCASPVENIGRADSKAVPDMTPATLMEGNRDEKAGNPLIHFSDEQLEVELFRRQNCYKDTESARDRMKRTLAPVPYRDYMEMPVWELGVDTLYNVIANGFFRNLQNMIDVTDKEYLTKETVERLCGRLNELCDKAEDSLNEALIEKFGKKYKLPGYKG